MERRFVEDMLALIGSILIFVCTVTYLEEFGILPKYKLVVLLVALALFYFRRRIADKLQ